MLFKKENDEVLYPKENFLEISFSDILNLKNMAEKNPRKRIRLCFHQAPDDLVHEMLIIHSQECYIRPHCHTSRDESLFILEGEADLIIFDDDGSIADIIELGDINSGKTVFKKINMDTIHTLIIHTEYLVFKEVTKGPFDKNSTSFPNWSLPEDSSVKAIDFYLEFVKTKADKIKEA